MKKKLIDLIVKLIARLIFICIAGIPIMYLWNYAVTDMFGLKEITYSQAVSIYILYELVVGNNNKS